VSRPDSTPGVGLRTVDSVEALIAPSLEQLGYEVVIVELLSMPLMPTLRISIDRLAQAGQVSIEDCVRVNRLLEESTELDDLIPGPYNLEISSPGVNRPLVKPRDFARFSGEKAHVTLTAPIEGRRNFTGRIVSMEGDIVRLDLGRPGVISFPISQIARGHLKPDTADLFRRQRAQEPVAELVMSDAAGEGGVNGDPTDEETPSDE